MIAKSLNDCCGFPGAGNHELSVLRADLLMEAKPSVHILALGLSCHMALAEFFLPC